MSTLNFELIRPLVPFVKDIGNKLSLDESLILAVIYQESRGNNYAARLESSYLEKGLFHLPLIYAQKLFITSDTEKYFQATSWGCMQVMGVRAREMGFGEILSRLINPNEGIFYGSKILDQNLIRFGNKTDAISAYNQGSPEKEIDGFYKNQSYVDDVLNWESQIKLISPQ